MNEQEKATYFSAQVDALLQKSAPTMVDDDLDETDQVLLDLARLLSALDFSAQSQFLRQSQPSQGVKPMANIWTGRRVLAGFSAILLLLLLAVTAITPVRVLAQEVWQSLFVRHDNGSIRLSEPVVISAEPTATPIPVVDINPAMSISEADALAPFTVREPAAMPPGYILTSVYYNETLKRVTCLYLNGGLGISLHQEPADMADPGIIGPEASVETVQIGDAFGEYVRGTWADVGHNDGVTITVTEHVWDSDDPYQQLRWTNDGVVYTLGTTVGQDLGLTQADLIAIATSLQ